MASPQKEHGYTALANELLEAIVAAPLSGGQMRLLMYLARQSYGYQTTNATLSATDYAKATKMHPKAVAKDLRELEARGYIVVLRQEGRTSNYRIQKDYTRWGTGSQTTPGTGSEMAPPPGAKRLPDRERNGTRPYKVVKETPKERDTEPHGSGASAAPVFVGTLRERFEAEYKAAGDQRARLTVVGRYFEQMLGPPNYGRLAKLLAEAKSGGALFGYMAEAAKFTITDDPHSYLAKVIQRAQHDRASGRMTQADHNSARSGRLVT